MLSGGAGLLNRREFNGLCGALSSWLPAVSAMFTGLPGASAFAAANGVDSNAGGRTVKFPDGAIVPACPSTPSWEARDLLRVHLVLGPWPLIL